MPGRAAVHMVTIIQPVRIDENQDNARYRCNHGVGLETVAHKGPSGIGRAVADKLRNQYNDDDVGYQAHGFSLGKDTSLARQDGREEVAEYSRHTGITKRKIMVSRAK